jgi:hypothetical protein
MFPQFRTAVLVLACLPAAARAQSAAVRPAALYSSMFEPAFEQPTPAQPKQPPAKLPELKQAPPKAEPKAPPPTAPAEQPFANPFARATEAGGFAATSFNENFDGDNLGGFYRRLVTLGYAQAGSVVGFNQQIVGTTQQQVGTTPRVVGTTQQVVLLPDASGQLSPIVVTKPIIIQDPVYVLNPVIRTTPIVATQLTAQQAVVLLPAATRYSGIQITDNDSPRPTDRLYFGYQFYSNAGASLNPVVGGSDVQRQMAGFETTVLDGNGSIGMRLPFVQQYGPGIYATQNVGDLSVLFKYAFLNDRTTGDVASAGLVVTTPTGGGGNVILLDGSRAPHSTLFQPWTGFVSMFQPGYVQGITNLIVPTDSRDPTAFGASLGAGYFLYQNPRGLLTAFIPRAEVHVRTPFNHRDVNGLVYFPDQVSVNGGATIRFGRAALNASVNVPVVGPRPWALEAVSFLNVNF